jgi:thioredoxin 2
VSVVTCSSCGSRNRLPQTITGIPQCAACHAGLPWSVSAGEDDFDEAIATRLPVLVDLWAPWCGPCRVVAPAVEEAGRMLAGRLKVVKVNVDEAPSVSHRFGVRGVPTLLVLRDGQLVTRRVGAAPADVLLEWVREAVDVSTRAV